MSIVDSYNTHVLNLLIEVIFLVVRDVNRNRVTEKLVDLFQRKAFGLS